MVAGEAGEVDRMKGIAKTKDSWLRFDVAGGRASVAAHVPQANERPRALAIGRDLDLAFLDRAFSVIEADGLGAARAGDVPGVGLMAPAANVLPAE